MKNAIYKICEKLKGYLDDEEYFEVLQVRQNKDNKYVVVVRAINSNSEKDAGNESNK